MRCKYLLAYFSPYFPVIIIDLAKILFMYAVCYTEKLRAHKQVLGGRNGYGLDAPLTAPLNNLSYRPARIYFWLLTLAIIYFL